MPLQSLVSEVRKNYTQQPQEEKLEEPTEYKYKKPLPRFIVADSEEWQNKAKQKARDWLECRHLKQQGEKNFCTQFCSLCAKEKCDPKYME